MSADYTCMHERVSRRHAHTHTRLPLLRHGGMASKGRAERVKVVKGGEGAGRSGAERMLGMLLHMPRSMRLCPTVSASERGSKTALAGPQKCVKWVAGLPQPPPEHAPCVHGRHAARRRRTCSAHSERSAHKSYAWHWLCRRRALCWCKNALCMRGMLGYTCSWLLWHPVGLLSRRNEDH